ncbi:hypothetical protein BH11PLA1_BH11PLA1_07190 [soil metagenome]
MRFIAPNSAATIDASRARGADRMSADDSPRASEIEGGSVAVLEGGDANTERHAAVRAAAQAVKVEVQRVKMLPHEEGPVPLATRVANAVGILVPLLGLIVAIVLLWGVAFNWMYLALLMGMYLVTGLGITVGFHRYFTHRSFKGPKWVTALLGITGSAAMQGPVLEWVAVHRRHHECSDEEHDPHSPHTHGGGIAGAIGGAIHAHFGWLLSKKNSSYMRYVVDLQKDPVIRFIDKTFLVWVALGLVVPAAIAGLATMSWTGALLGMLWGGLVRIWMVHHITWSVNSVCHIWGTRPYESGDHSRNNVIVGVLALGEGWHNNHHAFPASARHGLQWWQFDLSWICVWAMSKVGMAKEIRIPSEAKMKAKLKGAGAG